MNDRVATGIPGLDDILHGGIPRNQLVLLTGTSGTGKTILAMEYIFSGAKQHNEPGVYLTFEEPADFLRQHMRPFGWDIAALEKAGKFAFLKYDPFRMEDVLEILESTIREVGAKRVVIDSISALGMHVHDRAELRKLIFDLSYVLRRLNCTAMIISEIVHGTEPRISRYGVEEFVADSVIVLYYHRIISSYVRGIQVWKLRGSTHSEKIHPYVITEKGVVINPEDEAFVRER